MEIKMNKKNSLLQNIFFFQYNFFSVRNTNYIIYENDLLVYFTSLKI